MSNDRTKKVRALSSFLSTLTLLGVSAIVAVLLNIPFRDWLIICFGIRIFQLIRLGSIGIVAICAMITAFRFVSLVTTILQQKSERERRLTQQQEQVRVLTDYTEDSTNPEFTRKRLEQLQREMPEIDSIIKQCLDQMDKMDELQSKQHVLLKTNDARYLKETVQVLDNVERRICRNFRNVINLCIIADEVTQIDMKEIEKNLLDNAKKLDNSKELLRASAKQINRYNAGESYGSWDEVESWIAAILNSLKEEEEE